jgi:branched-chain amino acid transport system substrate-binding protein
MRSVARIIGAVALATGAMAGLSSCTFLTVDRIDCSTDRTCQQEFGAGSICVADGFCERVELPDRCRHVYPEDLFDPGEHRDTIVLGSIMDFSLDTQVGRVKSIQLALSGANDFDGLAGRDFGVAFCDVQEDGENQSAAFDDNLTQAEAALENASFLVDRLRVPVIIGPSASTDTIETFTQVVKGSATLQITPSGSSEALSGLETGQWSDSAPGMLWRTTPPDTILGAAKASDMLARGIRRIVIVGVAGYGATLGRAVQDAFLAGGGESAELTTFEASNDTDRQQKIIAAAADNPTAQEVIFVSSNTPDMIAFMQIATTNAAYADKSVFLSVAAANADFIQNAPGDLFGPFAPVEGEDPVYRFRTVRFAPPQGSVYNNYLSLYAGTFDGEDASVFSFVAQAYDAAWLALYGAAWSVFREGGEVTGAGMARGLRQMSRGERVVIDPSTWPLVLSSFEAGRAIDVDGASGPLDYDPTTEETTGPVEVVVIDRAEDSSWAFQVVETYQP